MLSVLRMPVLPPEQFPVPVLRRIHLLPVVRVLLPPLPGLGPVFTGDIRATIIIHTITITDLVLVLLVLEASARMVVVVVVVLAAGAMITTMLLPTCTTTSITPSTTATTSPMPVIMAQFHQVKVKIRMAQNIKLVHPRLPPLPQPTMRQRWVVVVMVMLMLILTLHILCLLALHIPTHIITQQRLVVVNLLKFFHPIQPTAITPTDTRPLPTPPSHITPNGTSYLCLIRRILRCCRNF